MKLSKLFSVIAIVSLISWLAISTVYATAEIGKKEGKACTVCHVKPVKGDENLNDTGKCYKEKKDLKACEKK